MFEAAGQMSRAAGYTAAFLLGLLIALSPGRPASAATIGVNMTVVKNCTMGTISGVTFANGSSTTSPIYSSGSISFTCTNALPVTIGLNAGTGSGATSVTRYMTGPSSAEIGYYLGQDSNCVTNWGNTSFGWVSTTGTGSTQTLTVYGCTIAHATPRVGSYADSVTITITY